MATFFQLFESVPDALMIVDSDGRILMANQNAARLFGYPDTALEGRRVEDLVPEETRARHQKYRVGYMHQPKVRPMGSGGMMLVGQKRDGQLFPVEIALSPLESEQGHHYLASSVTSPRPFGSSRRWRARSTTPWWYASASLRWQPPRART